MTGKPSYEELARRIAKHLAGDERNKELIGTCWNGYLAALLEWDLISPEDHRRLIQLLPPVKHDPTVHIFLGSA